MHDLPVAHEEGEVGFDRDTRQDDAAMRITVGQHLGHQDVRARQVLGGAAALTQAAMGHLPRSKWVSLQLFVFLNICSLFT